jgi:endonuclease/exonuclease/phosphatase family metal-dependent hydrolase
LPGRLELRLLRQGRGVEARNADQLLSTKCSEMHGLRRVVVREDRGFRRQAGAQDRQAQRVGLGSGDFADDGGHASQCSHARLAQSILLFLLCVACFTTAQAEPREIVVASYNIENYLGPTPADEAAATPSKPKAESAKAALVAIVKEINPDILGVCEMGRAEEFEDFKKRLAQAGLGFTDFEYVAGPDVDRHLALLSRFPIVARHSLTDVPYELRGTPQKVKRGFLDVTVRVNESYDLRLVGVHLKSKRPVPLGEEVERRREAQLLRRHAEEIMTADPAVHLLLYGDFNELKSEPAILAIAGPPGSPQHLTELPLHDSLGDRWTQYWKAADLYSRFDYFFASPGLAHEIVLPHSGIYRSDLWNKASDHRPIYTAILPVNRK